MVKQTGYSVQIIPIHSLAFPGFLRFGVQVLTFHQAPWYKPSLQCTEEPHDATDLPGRGRSPSARNLD